MLAPHTCSGELGDSVYDRYLKIRGKSEISDGVGLPLNRLHEIQANNEEQPCLSFGIHEKLTVLKDLYNDGKVNFIANGEIASSTIFHLFILIPYTNFVSIQLVSWLNQSTPQITVVRLLFSYLLTTQ